MMRIDKIKALGSREKKFIFSSVSNFGVKGVSMFVGLLSLPVIYKAIGTERYGMMLSITSIAAVINFADLGLGFGLQNRIPRLIQEKEDILHRTISSTFFFLVFSSVIVFAFFCFVSNFIDWEDLLNLHSQQAKDEVDLSVYLFAFFLCLSVPFSIVQKIQIGLQEGYNTNLWVSGGSAFGLIVLIILYQFHITTPLVIISIFGANTLFIVLNFIHYFFFKRRDLLPSIRATSFQLIKSVITESFLFFWVQLLALVLFTSNSILLVHYNGPETVTEFNIAYKLLLLFMIPIESSAPYITPALNEAVVKGDNDWIKKSISRGLTTTMLISIVIGFIIFLTGNLIVKVWIGESALLDIRVILSLSFYLVLFSGIGCILSYVMLSSSFIRRKSIIYTVAVMVTVAVKIISIKYYDVEGAIWSTTLPMFFLYIIPCLVLLKREKLL